jgi:DNA ligase-1
MNEKEKEKEKEKEAMAKEKGKKKKPNANSKKKKDDDFEIEEDNDSEPEKNKNSILFREFVDVLLKIEKCKGLNSKDTVKETLCDFFIHIFEKYPQDFTKIYYFLSYKIGPTYLIPDLVILSDKLEEMVIRLFNLSDNSLKDNLKHYGDLGQVASDIKQTDEEMNAFHNYVDKKRKNLSIASIMTSLEEAALGDENSGDKSKIKIIYNLMVKTGKDEIKFLIRFLEKNLKLGISQSLLLSSISRAISRMYKNTNEADINKVLSKCKSQIDDEDIIFGYVIEMIKNKTDFKRLIDLCHIRCGVPFKYQLSDSTSGIKTMIKEVGKNSFTCENLYHGMR